VDFIHREGFIHRDIKPANILFDREGHAYLSDFGIAKTLEDSEPGRKVTAALTGIGMVIGTAEYMAPELVMGEAFDHRVDQYALAVTVYEVLCGRPPFQGKTAAVVMVKQTSEPVPDLRDSGISVPDSVAVAVSCALSKNPEERFATCMEFAAAAIPGGVTESSAAGRGLTGEVTGDRVVARACPGCGREMRFRTQHARKAIQCKGCAAKLQVAVDLSRLSPITGSSSQMATTVVPVATDVNTAKDSVRHRNPGQSPQGVRRFASSWLPWSVAVGVFAVLVVMGLFSAFGPRSGENSNEFIPPPAVTKAENDSVKDELSPDAPANSPSQVTRAGNKEAKDKSATGSSSDGSEITNSIGMRMKLIPTGEFLMGSPGTDGTTSPRSQSATTGQTMRAA